MSYEILSPGGGGFWALIQARASQELYTDKKVATFLKISICLYQILLGGTVSSGLNLQLLEM